MWAEGPRRYSWPPKTLSIRRTACGPRPARSAASSMTAFISPMVSGVTPPRLGSQPSPSRPVSRSIRGLRAPIQICTSCSGTGPACMPLTR